MLPGELGQRSWYLFGKDNCPRGSSLAPSQGGVRQQGGGVRLHSRVSRLMASSMSSESSISPQVQSGEA